MCNINSVHRSICACACMHACLNEWCVVLSCMWPVIMKQHSSSGVCQCEHIQIHMSSSFWYCVCCSHMKVLWCWDVLSIFLITLTCDPCSTYSTSYSDEFIYTLYRIVFVLLYCSVSVSQRKMRGSWVWLLNAYIHSVNENIELCEVDVHFIKIKVYEFTDDDVSETIDWRVLRAGRLSRAPHAHPPVARACSQSVSHSVAELRWTDSL